MVKKKASKAKKEKVKISKWTGKPIKKRKPLKLPKKAKVGAPTKYRKELVKLIPDMFKDGQSILEVTCELNIHKDTFYEWKEKYPEFSDAVDLGLQKAQALWEKMGRLGSFGKEKLDARMYQFNMKNRYKKEWRDRHDVEVTDKTPVQDMPEDQLKKAATAIITSMTLTLEDD